MLTLEPLENRRLLSAALPAFVGPAGQAEAYDFTPVFADLRVEAAWAREVEASRDAEAHQWVVRSAAGPADVAGRLGLPRDAVVQAGEVPDAYVVKFAGDVTSALLGRAGFAGNAYAVMERDVVPRSVVRPNDPLLDQQWHLDAYPTSAAVIDANVAAAWQIPSSNGGTLTGKGVTIGVIDDGVFYNHPDLTQNYDRTLHYNYQLNTSDPRPASTWDSHGTSVAGVAAARGNNGIGGAGAAYEASLTGLRIFGGSGGSSDVGEGGALNHRSDAIGIYNNSWGPSDDGTRFESPGPIAAAALRAAATFGRGGLGSVHVWAGGNGGDHGDDVNRDGYANSRHTIAVGAVSNSGVRSAYSEEGSSLLVTAPSNGGSLGITTTTGEFNYTSSFGGTSSATPLVSGVIALMLEANPGLTYRDVQHVLVDSSRPIDTTRPGWQTNASGRMHSHAYGFGVVDAAAAVTLAAGWPNVGVENVYTTGVRTNLGDIANNGTPNVTTFQVPAGIVIEHIDVDVNIAHGRRGDVEVVLTSPSGTTSRLLRNNSDNNANINNWTLNTVRHWGEETSGTWTLTVTDRRPSNNVGGTLQSAGIRFYGTGDVAAPAAVATFDNSRSHAFTYVFDRDFPTSPLAAGLTLLNQTTGRTFTAAVTSFDQATLTARFEVQAAAGTTLTAAGKSVLPDGRYTATLPETLVDRDGRRVAPTPLAFHVLRGDANGDGAVTLADFAVVRSHFGRTNAVFSQGDFNYDGQVTLADFAVVRSMFGTTLPQSPAGTLFADDEA